MQSILLLWIQAGLASEGFLEEVSSGLKSEEVHEYKQLNQSVLKVLDFTMKALGSWKGCKDYHDIAAFFNLELYLLAQ